MRASGENNKKCHFLQTKTGKNKIEQTEDKNEGKEI